MHYISTRGQSPKLNFAEVATAGLAPDGGLYLPSEIPHFSAAELARMAQLPYTDLAVEVMYPFAADAFTREEFAALVKRSYARFRHMEITPLHKLTDNHYVLELFHGPTLAFKDVALQFLGQLLDVLLTRNNERAVIIGATSGDTGSAAIEGVLACKHVQLFMLHPHGRVSEVQRRQMTTVHAPHIHNLAVEGGTFDDCQDMVKDMFQQPEFMAGAKLTAVNSINWARIMAQIVYYFYASFRVGKPCSFSVPTGNFGDIYAGFIAKQMGLPMHKLIVATNQNDILDRFFKANDYRQNGVVPTNSPSMDIQISSNFERALFDLHGRDGAAIANLMQRFKADKSMQVSTDVLTKAREHFSSHATSTEATVEIIRKVHQDYGYTVDPHTATGINASWHHAEKDVPIVTLATAHPAKFPDVVNAATGLHPALPEHLKDLLQKPEFVTRVPNNLAEVKKTVRSTASL